MPISTDNLYNISRLNRWFAISGLAMLASLVWMIWKDYDRPWRGIQDDYMVAQAALAHLDYLETQTDAYQWRVDAEQVRVDEARAAAADRADERSEFAASLKQANAEHDGIKITFGNAEAIVQVTRSSYEVTLSEYGADAPETGVVKDELDRQEKEVVDLRRTMEQIEDRQRAFTRELKDIDASVVKAEKRLGQLVKVSTDAGRKERQYSDVLIKGIINAPLLDFTAPRGTPSRQEVRQVLLPGVHQELNYLRTYTTDRCTTCHVAIDDRAFSRDVLARRFERALPAMNECIQRTGLPQPTSDEVAELLQLSEDESRALVQLQESAPEFAPLGCPPPELSGDEVPDLKAGAVTAFWDYLSDDQQDRYFDRMLALVNTYLDLSGRKQVRLGQPLLAHPNLDLFVHVDSAHPRVKLGCTVCHEGNPQETDFVQAAHTPVDHHQEQEWKEKYYVTAALVPNITFETVEHYWDRSMHLPQYSEAGCAKCHSRIADILEFQGESQAQKLNLGRDLFTRVGCINCHNVEDLGAQPRVGPDLTRIASKIPKDFAEPWIYHPKRFRPSTWMPHLFLQENNGAGSDNEFDPNPVLRTESEVAAIAFYLFALSDAWEPQAIPDGLSGDAGRGQELFKEVGCLACHANVKEFGQDMIVSDMVMSGRSERVSDALFDEMRYTDRVNYLMEHLPSDRDTVFAPESIGDQPMFTRFAPELSAIGSKVSRAWLFGWLKDPKSYLPETRMPSMRLTDQEAVDIVEYLLTLRSNETFESGQFPDDDAHREMTDGLVFQIISGQSSAARTRMVMADEGGELTATLVNTLKAYWDEDTARSKLSGMNAAEKRKLFLGNKMIAHYGCYACHTIGGFETSPPPGTDLSTWAEKPLSQLDFAFFDVAHDHLREAKPEVFGHVYRPEDADLIYWSRGENPEERVTHTHGGFAWHKMMNPRFWDREKIKRPYDKLKMPNFYFTEQQADALVTYLLSRREARVDPELTVKYDSTLKGAIAEGRNLTRSLNCVGCHKIEGNVATVHQYFEQTVGGETSFDEVNAPPWLRGEGAKARYPWLYTFFNQVETLRPWLKIRMPSFGLTEEETTTLVKYFAGISGQESATLRVHLASIEKYLKGVHEKIAVDGPDAAPDPETWFVSDALRDTADYLASYTVKNRQVLIYDVDPAENTVDDLKTGYTDVLSNSRFTAHLFDVKFPFAEQDRPLVGEERFKLGEEFFFELKCLACHVLGDPLMEGSNANPSAPNLAMVHSRLRQEWVYRWLQEPGSIQPGTKMPQWFAGGASAFLSYGDADRAALEAKYGQTGEEQMQLLMDYMYNAGVKNVTALQPGGLSAAGDEAGDDDEEEDEDEEEEEEEEE